MLSSSPLPSCEWTEKIRRYFAKRQVECVPTHLAARLVRGSEEHGSLFAPPVCLANLKDRLESPVHLLHSNLESAGDKKRRAKILKVGAAGYFCGGEPYQEFLGHNDIKTRLHYIHVSNRTLENIKSPFDALNLKNE